MSFSIEGPPLGFLPEKVVILLYKGLEGITIDLYTCYQTEGVKVDIIVTINYV